MVFEDLIAGFSPLSSSISLLFYFLLIYFYGNFLQTIMNFILFHFQRFFTNVFNGCYAILMFIVVIFFLIYGVEVYFKVFTSILIVVTVSLPGICHCLVSVIYVLESSSIFSPTGSWWLFA